MMLKLGRIAIVSAAVLTLAAAAIPTKAEAADLPIPRVPVIPRAPVAYGGGLLPSLCSAASAVLPSLRSASTTVLPSLCSATSSAVLCLWRWLR